MKKVFVFFLCLALLLIPLSSGILVAASPAGYTFDGNKTYTVTTAEGFLEAVALVNAGRSDYNITLGADLDLDGKVYTPIAATGNRWTSEGVYTGTIDGNGHTIYNLTVSETGTAKGLIAYSGDGVTVKNLTLENPSIVGEGFEGEYCGFVIANSLGTNVTISGVHVVNGNASSMRNYVGGLVGRYDGTTVEVTTLIENCTVDANLSGTQSVGGVVGGEGVGVGSTLRFRATFRNIAVKGCFTASNATSRIGGIIGYSNLADLTFENCVTLNDASGGNDIGGLTGVANKSNFSIANCYSNQPFSGRLTPGTSDTIAIESSAVVSNTDLTADFFSEAPSAANAAKVTVTVDGKETSCEGLQITTVIGDVLKLKIDEIYAGNAEFLAISKLMLADRLSYISAVTSALALRALQESEPDPEKNTFSIRLIGTIATSYQRFDSLGFYVGYTDPSQTVYPGREVGLTTVYTSILANEDGNIVTHTAAEFGGDYIAALTLKDIPASGTCVFDLTPYSIIDGSKLTGTTHTVTFVDGVLKNVVSEDDTQLLTSVFDATSIGQYTIVYASEPVGLESVAISLRDAIRSATGKTLPVTVDSASSEKTREILIGPTNRALSQKSYAASGNFMHYEIKSEDGKLQFVVGGPYSGLKCVETFASNVLGTQTQLYFGTSYYATELATDTQELTSGADIRVMSANVLNYHWGEESNPNIYPVAVRCEIFAAVLQNFKPDLIGLQEADENWRDALPYYLNCLAEKHHLDYTHLLPNAFLKGKTVVNYSSILYRSDLYDVEDSGCMIYAANYQSSYCQRVGTYAKFTSKTDPAKQAILVNSQWAHETEARILSCVNEQAALINNLKSQYPGVPVFSVGDYNSDPKRKPTNETNSPDVKTRDQYFLQFVDQISGNVASTVAGEKGVLITNGGCRGNAERANENTMRAIDYEFIDHIVVSGGYADVLRHDTIRTNRTRVMSDHSLIYADFSLKEIA